MTRRDSFRINLFISISALRMQARYLIQRMKIAGHDMSGKQTVFRTWECQPLYCSATSKSDVLPQNINRRLAVKFVTGDKTFITLKGNQICSFSKLIRNTMKLIRTCTLLLLVTILFNSCQDPELPEASQEGKNVFGCRVNGRIWLPKGDLFIPARRLLYVANLNGGTLIMNARYGFRDKQDIKIANKENIDIYFRNITTTGQYTFNKADSSGFAQYTFITQYENSPTIQTRYCDYNGSRDIQSGILNITKLDLNKSIIAGTFSFTLSMQNPSSDCSSEVQITDGRFDFIF